MLFFGDDKKTSIPDSQPEPSGSSWTRVIATLFPFLGVERTPTSLKDSDLSDKSLSSLSKDLENSGVEQGKSLLGAEVDLADRNNNRSKIEKLIESIIAKPANAVKEIVNALPKIDLVYAEPREKGVMINALMMNRMKKDSQQAIVKITNSLLVDWSSEHEDAQQFRAQIDEMFHKSLELSLALARRHTVPLEKSIFKGDRSFDGALIAEGGKAYAGTTPYQWLKPLNCSATAVETCPAFYVNGLNMSIQGHIEDLKIVSQTFQRPIFGVHNAKLSNPASEFTRALNDSHNRRGNPTIDTVRDLVLGAIYNDTPITLIAESHGCGIVSRGIQRAISVLNGKGWSEEQVKEAMQKINVETYAGATWEYPDGPKYKHHVLLTDPVPYFFGVTKLAVDPTQAEQIEAFFGSRKDRFFAGLQRFAALVYSKHPNPRIHPGEGAEIIVLDQGETLDREENPHEIMSYLERRARLEGPALKRTGTDG